MHYTLLLKALFVTCLGLGLFTTSGCGESPNRVVGESNGWTIEEVERVRKEEEKQRELAEEKESQ